MSSPSGDERALSDEERARAILEQLQQLHTWDLGYESMIGLVSFGYQKMGLTAETAAARNLDDARLAIELLKATLGVFEREPGAERLGSIRDTLAQMQLNYARAVQREAEAEPQATAAEAEQTSAAETPTPEDTPAAESTPAAG